MQLIDIAHGLDYLHSHGVIHGNLKQVGNPPECTPLCVVLTKCAKENILVNSAGRACLSDIGFAKLMSIGESSSRFDWAQVGADGCRWAAPEIFQNGKFTKQSDMFSYGFIAVEVRPLNHCLESPRSTLPRYSRDNSCGGRLIQRE